MLTYLEGSLWDIPYGIHSWVEWTTFEQEFQGMVYHLV